MSVGPVERLLDLLAEPARVLVGSEYQTAATLRAQEDFATLAEYYELLSTRASRAGDYRQAQRLLLAERSVAR